MPDSQERAYLDPATLERLGLVDQPFGTPNTIYQDQERATRLTIALDLLADGATVVLSGPAGVGKTTFLHQLCRRTDELAVTFMDAHDQLRLSDIVEAMGAHGGDATPSAIWDMLRDAKQQSVLVLDHGERLPASVLRRLARLQGAMADNGLALPMLIAVDKAEASSVTATLDSNRNPLTYLETIKLSGFGPIDASAYLRLRIAEAGGDHTLLSHRQIKRIQARSNGLPGAMDTQAARTLQARIGGRAGFLNALHGHLAALKDWRHVGVLTSLALLATGSIWWLMTPDVGSQPEAIESPTEVASADAPPKSEAAGGSSASNDSATSLAVSEANDAGQTGDRPDDQRATGATSGANPTPEGEDTVRLADRPQPSAEAAASEADGSDAPSPEANNAEPSDPPKTDAAAEPQASPDDQVTASAKDSNTGSEEPASAAEPSVSDTAVPLDSAWYADQPSDHYTIQLLGGREPATVKRFLGQIPSPEDTRILLTTHDGGRWYVVVTGSYAQRSEANKAIEALPSEWRDYDPFPRAFESLAPRDNEG